MKITDPDQNFVQRVALEAKVDMFLEAYERRPDVLILFFLA